MSIEGKIHIRLDPGSDCPVHIRSSRPGEVCRLFEGLSPEAVLTRLPALFSVCGHGQALASRHAFAALNAAQAPGETALQAALCEALQTLLWRFLIDLPQRLGREPALAAFTPVHRGLRGFGAADGATRETTLGELHELLRRELLGMSAERWQAQTPAQQQSWLRGFPSPLAVQLRAVAARLAGLPAPSSPTALMPEPESRFLGDLAVAMVQPEFASRPRWQGACLESGALADHQHHPWLAERLAGHDERIVTRLLARLLEVLALYRQLADSGSDAPARAGGMGLDGGLALGWVRTARGVLVHRVQMVRGQVADYRILAPTDWNFHPRGALYQGLENWLQAAPERLDDWVALQVLSLDPCVDYECEVSHA